LKLGVLLEQGGSLASMRNAGQEDRLRYYFDRYRESFSDVVFFSYGDEGETALGGARIAPRKSRLPTALYSFRLPWAHREELASCSVLRVLQLTAAIPAAIAKALYRVPYAVTFGYDPRPLPGHRFSGLSFRAARRTADVLFCATERLRRRMIDARPRGRIELLPNGVDLSLFPCRTEPPSRSVPRRILTVGRLSREKNHAMLIEAARGLDDVEIHVAGSGPEREELEARARGAGVTLILHGTVPQRELGELYRSADVFVLASLSEGLPKALLEAMASGVPCVGTEVPGIQDLLEHERTGLLVPPSADALRRGMVRALESPELARGLVTAARKEIEEVYDLRVVLSREIEILKSLVQAEDRSEGRG
jgi:glycosyltransferase involved in cell wall biosynthesis